MPAAEDRTPRLIGLDWGGSSLRAYLLAEGGAILEERRRPWGILHLPEGGFRGALDEIVGDWRAASPAIPLIACGMVGSAQGWHQVPYRACPASAGEIAGGLVSVDLESGSRLHIVPGVRRDGDRPDVMRGEETQIVGVVARNGLRSGRFVMPGTHSKWVDVREQEIASFTTFMTGELFAALSEHTILGRPAREAEAGRAGSSSDDAFDRGVRAILDAHDASLTALLFSVRALVLSSRLRAEDSLEYLSGLLIGDEIRSAAPDPADRLILVGDPALCSRYQRALGIFGISGTTSSEAAPAGLWEIARRAALLSGPSETRKD